MICHARVNQKLRLRAEEKAGQPLRSRIALPGIRVNRRPAFRISLVTFLRIDSLVFILPPSLSLFFSLFVYIYRISSAFPSRFVVLWEAKRIRVCNCIKRKVANDVLSFRISYFVVCRSYLRLQISDFGFRISDFRLTSAERSNFRVESSNLRL